MRLPYKFNECPHCGSKNIKVSTAKRVLGLIGECKCKDCGFRVNTSNDCEIPLIFSTKFHARKAIRLIWNSIEKDFLRLTDYQKQFIRSKEMCS